MTRSRILALAVFLIAAMTAIFPETAFLAALEGLKLWFEIVLPTLLPFFIMAEPLMGLGRTLSWSALEPLCAPVQASRRRRLCSCHGNHGRLSLGAKITGDLVRSRS